MSSPRKRRSGASDDSSSKIADPPTGEDELPQERERPRTRGSSKKRDEESDKDDDSDSSSDDAAEPPPKSKKGKAAAKTGKGQPTKKKPKASKKAKKGEDPDEDDTKKKTGKKNIKDLFEPWEDNPPHPPDEEEVPEFEEHWGWVIQDLDDHDFKDQPAAKDSKGQTKPPLWENRERPCVRGDRYLTVDDEEIDQQDHLVLRLLDMRKSKDSDEPRRNPMHAAFQHGTPKDWNDSTAITKINQSRKDYIKRVCCDKVWTNMEARFLAKQFEENADISIKELTCRLNDEFIGKQYIDNPQKWDNNSKGRTIECVRAEYLDNASKYDKGEAPHKEVERDRHEIVESSPDNLTVGAMMDAEDENKVEIPRDKNKKALYSGLLIDDLRKHAVQRKPPVSLEKLRTKALIIQRLQEADEFGVDENGLPKNAAASTSKKGRGRTAHQSPGTLSPTVVDLIFNIDEADGASGYDARIARLQKARDGLVSNDKTQEAEELTQVTKSLIAARGARLQAKKDQILAEIDEKKGALEDEDVEMYEAHIKELQKKIEEIDAQKGRYDDQTPKAESNPPKKGLGSKRLPSTTGEPTHPSKRRKTSDSSQKSSTSNSGRAAGNSSPDASPTSSRKSSRVKINEKANQVIGPGSRADKSPTHGKRKSSSSSSSGASKSPRRPLSSPPVRRRSSESTSTKSPPTPRRRSSRSQSSKEDDPDPEPREDEEEKGDEKEDEKGDSSDDDESTASDEE